MARPSGYDLCRWMEKHHLRQRMELKKFSDADMAVLMNLYSYLDDDGNGTVELDELYNAMDKLGMNSEKAQVVAQFHYLDADKSGSIDFDEFLAAVAADKASRDRCMLQNEIKTQEWDGAFFRFVAAFRRSKIHSLIENPKATAADRYESFRELFDMPMVPPEELSGQPTALETAVQRRLEAERMSRLSIDFRTPEQMVEAATTAMRRASISGSDQPMSKPFNLTLKLSDQIGVEQRQVLERDLFSTSLTGAGTDRQASQSVKSKLIAQQVYSQLRQHQDTTDDAFANDADVNSSQDSPSMFTYEDIGAPSTIASPANKRRGPVCLHSPALVQRTVLPNTHRVIQHRPGVAKPVMTRSPHDSTLAVGSITQMATDLCSSPSYAKSPYREYKSGQKVRMKSPRRLRKMNRVFWNSSHAVSKSKFQAQLHSAKAVKPADNSDIRPRPPLTATSVSFRGTRGSSNSPRVGGRKPRSQQAPDRTSSRNEGEHFFGPRTATKQHSFGQPQARGRNASEGFSSLSLQSTGHLAPKSLNRGSIGVDGMPVVPSRIFAWNEASAQPSLEHDSSSLSPSPGAVPPPRSGSIRRSIGRASRLHAGEGFSTTLSSLTPRIQSHTQQPQDHPGRDRTSTTAEHSFVDFGDDPSGVVPASTRLSPLQSRASPVAFELSRIAVQSYASSPQGASGGLETSGTVQHAAAVHGSELQSESNEEHSLSSVVHPDANNETSTGHVAATGVDAEAAVPDSAHHPTAPSPSGQSAPAPLKMSLPTACGESPAQETPLSLAAVANESVFYMAGDDSASPPEHVPAPEVQGLQGTPPSAADEPTRVQVDDNDDASVATQVPYEDDDRTA